MPQTINGLWSSLRSAISDFNPFGHASDFSTFDYLEERVRELEQEVLGLRRELQEPRRTQADSSSLWPDQLAALHPQPSQRASRHQNRDGSPHADQDEKRSPNEAEFGTDMQGEQYRPRSRVFQRAEHAGFISIEAANPAYEVHWNNLAQPDCC
jgi:hypothetical protein